MALVRKLAGSGAGIGDDTAILRLPAGQELLVTTDLFVEGIHFRREMMSAAAAGRRAMSRALSDIAAMGGRPCWAFLSLAAPSEPDPRWLRGFLNGFAAAARTFGVTVAGGDTGSSGSAVFLADVMVCGSAARGRAVRRSGAKPGDAIYVSGPLGRTAAALASGRPLPPVRPRLKLGAALASLATAMIDISDGLSTDLHHICEESGVGAEIEAARIPLAGTLEQALNGGEDYELLFTSRGKVPTELAQIGRIVNGRRVMLLHADGRRERLLARGWEHFSGSCSSAPPHA